MALAQHKSLIENVAVPGIVLPSHKRSRPSWPGMLKRAVHWEHVSQREIETAKGSHAGYVTQFVLVSIMPYTVCWTISLCKPWRRVRLQIASRDVMHFSFQSILGSYITRSALTASADATSCTTIHCQLCKIDVQSQFTLRHEVLLRMCQLNVCCLL